MGWSVISVPRSDVSTKGPGATRRVVGLRRAGSTASRAWRLAGVGHLVFGEKAPPHPRPRRRAAHGLAPLHVLHAGRIPRGAGRRRGTGRPPRTRWAQGQQRRGDPRGATTGASPRGCAPHLG